MHYFPLRVCNPGWTVGHYVDYKESFNLFDELIAVKHKIWGIFKELMKNFSTKYHF